MVQSSASCQMNLQDGNTYIYRYIQHLLTILATMRDSMPRAKVLGNNKLLINA